MVVKNRPEITVDHYREVVKEVLLLDKAVTRSWRYLVLAGVASVVFGAITLLNPGISLVALTALFGAFTFVFGAFGLAGGLDMLAHRSTEWVPYVLGGLAGLAIGAVTFFRPGLTDLALIYFIAAWAIIVGVYQIIAALDLWGVVKGAAWLALSGALSIVFGALVAIQPGSGALAILWLIGLYAILAGVSQLVAAYRIRSVQMEVRSDVKSATSATMQGGEARPQPQG